MRFILSIILVLSWTTARADGLQAVEQTIFGMDCAPCAYGIEKGLKRLEGVTQVEVSLNKGYARMAIAPDSEVNLAQIRDVVRKGGFTPRETQVEISGVLRQNQRGDLLLETSQGRFAVGADSDDLLDQLSGRVGETITLTASVPTDQLEQLLVLALR